MKNFELKTWMSANRELVIAKFNLLQNEKHYTGATLKMFMMDIFNAMIRNNPKSEKRAKDLLPFVMGNSYVKFSTIKGEDKITDALRAKYQGTCAMALV